MQVLNSLRNAKQRHPDCQIVKRKGRLYVICKTNPRFKAVQGRKKTLKTNSSGKAVRTREGAHFLLPAGFCAGQRKNIVEGKFALTGNHFLQLDFMFIIHLWRLKNRLNERGEQSGCCTIRRCNRPGGPAHRCRYSDNAGRCRKRRSH